MTGGQRDEKRLLLCVNTNVTVPARSLVLVKQVKTDGSASLLLYRTLPVEQTVTADSQTQQGPFVIGAHLSKFPRTGTRDSFDYTHTLKHVTVSASSTRRVHSSCIPANSVGQKRGIDFPPSCPSTSDSYFPIALIQICL